MTVTATVNKYFGANVQSRADVSAVKFTTDTRIHQVVFAKDRAVFKNSAEVQARLTDLRLNWSAYAVNEMISLIDSAPVVRAIPDITVNPFSVRFSTSDIGSDPATALFAGPLPAANPIRGTYRDFKQRLGSDTDVQKHLKDILGTHSGAFNDGVQSILGLAPNLTRLLGRQVVEVNATTMNALIPYLGRGLTAIIVDSNNYYSAQLSPSAWGGNLLEPGLTMPGYVMRGEETVAALTFTWMHAMRHDGVPDGPDRWGIAAATVASAAHTTGIWSRAEQKLRHGSTPSTYEYGTMWEFTGDPGGFGHAGAYVNARNMPTFENTDNMNLRCGVTWPGAAQYAAYSAAIAALGWNDEYRNVGSATSGLAREAWAYAVGRPPGVNSFYLRGSVMTSDAATRSVLLNTGIFGGMIENSALVRLMQTYLDDAGSTSANKAQITAAKSKMQESPDGYVAFCTYPTVQVYDANAIETTYLYQTYTSAAVEANDPSQAPLFYDIASADGTKLSTFRNNANAAESVAVLLTTADRSAAPTSNFLRAIGRASSIAVTIRKVTTGSVITWEASAMDGETALVVTPLEGIMLISAGASAVYVGTTGPEVDLTFTVSANQRALAVGLASSDLMTLDLRDLFPDGVPDMSGFTADQRARALFIMYGQKMTSLRALVIATLAYASVA